MSNEFENQIKEEVFKEKITNFFRNYKPWIIFLSLILIAIPIFLQIYFFYIKKNNENLLSQYLKAETLLNNNEAEAVNIFDKIKDNKNETISLLATDKLLQIYLAKNENQKVDILIDQKQNKSSLEIYDELKRIKKVLYNFDRIQEEEILKHLNNNKVKIFKQTAKKLLYDFYMKNNQYEKAKQIIKDY